MQVVGHHHRRTKRVGIHLQKYFHSRFPRLIDHPGDIFDRTENLGLIMVNQNSRAMHIGTGDRLQGAENTFGG